MHIFKEVPNGDYLKEAKKEPNLEKGLILP
jgi:hypothetical protein